MRTETETFIINPYIAGAPIKNPTMFFGRDDVYAWLRQHLRGRYQDNVIVLYGERRSGKTSVLYQMAEQLGDATYVPVLLDLQGMAMEGLDGFLWEIARKIVLSLRGVEGVPLLDRPSRRDFEENARHEFEEVFLPPIVAVLGERRLLLMFDETNRLEEKLEAGNLPPEAIGYLRSLIQHASHINFIFSIGNRVEEARQKTSELFNLAVYRKISFLDQDFAEDLITKPVAKHYSYTRPAIDKILRLTSGHPYYTQLLCHNLFARWSEHKPPQLDVADVEAVLPDIIEQATPNLQFAWDDSTPVEKAILAAMAATMPRYRAGLLRRNLEKSLNKANLYPPRRDVTTGLKRLFERDIINNQEPYEFRVEILRRWLTEFKHLEWVHEEIEATAADWEAKEQKRRREAPTTIEQAQRWLLPALAGILIGALLALLIVWNNPPAASIAAPEALSTQVKLATEVAVARTREAAARSQGDSAQVQAARVQLATSEAEAATLQAQLDETARQNQATVSAAETQQAQVAEALAPTQTAIAELQAAATSQAEVAALVNNTPTATATPQPTETPPPPPTATFLPTETPRPTVTPTLRPTGRLAIPVDNGVGGYDVHIYSLPDGALIKRIVNARQPNFDKESGRLAVRARRGDNETIWVYDADGENGQLANRVPSANSRPFWGPTGLVYENQSTPKDGITVWRIFVQEGPFQNTARDVSMLAGDIFDADQPLYPLWTDRDDIIFSACNYWDSRERGARCGVWRTPALATVDDRGFTLPTNLTSHEEIPTDVYEDRLLVMAQRGTNWELYRTSITGEALGNLSNHPANDGLGTFSPDGWWVAFVSNRGGDWGVWVVPSGGGEPRRLPIDGLDFATGDRNWTTERISWGP